jgi:hypothetical protein
MKFSVAPKSTRAVETTPEGKPDSEMGTRKCLAEKDDDEIPTPMLGDGISWGHASALVDSGLGCTGHLFAQSSQE